MKLSTRGRYGMRLILDIVINGGERPVTLREIAARQEISEKYLEQIISRLSKVGLVHGTRGVGGGYTLSRPADEITAGDVLRALEGSLSFVECTQPNSSCRRASECLTIGLWRELQSAVEAVADSHTLAELVSDCRQTRCAECDGTPLSV